MMSVEKSAYAGGVQAVQFSSDGKFVFAGIGPYFCVFHTFSGECLLRQLLFDGGCIKAIKNVVSSATGEPLVLVFGQRRINILKLFVDRSETSSVTIAGRIQFEEMNDWILDVTLLEPKDASVNTGNEQLMAIGFSQNFVNIVKFSYPEEFSNIDSENLTDVSLVKSCKGYPNCLLYSMSFYGNNMDNLLIASGTIFTQISIWSLKCCKDNATTDPLLILNGHDGVLFRIEWSKDGKSLCSTSDDRTVRLWRFSRCFVDGDDSPPKYQMITMFGHGARVWDCKMLDDFIVSCSEDRTVRVWDYSGNCVYVFRGHTGKNVWRVDIDPSQSIIVSGGGDSSIKFWSLDKVRHALKGGNHKQIILPGVDLNSKFDSTSEFTRFLRIYKQYIFAVTNMGYLYRVDNETQNVIRVLDLNVAREDTGKKAFIICFSISPCGNFCALGDTNGSCVVANIETGIVVADFPVFPTRLLNMFWLPRKDGSGALYLTSPHGTMKQFNTSVRDGSILVEPNHEFLIKYCAMSLCPVEELDILLVGDNRGHIHIFNNISQHTQSILEPVFTQRNAHGKDKVSDIKYIDCDRIYTVGRDGCLCTHKLQVQDNGPIGSNQKLELNQVRQTRLNNTVPTAERLYISDDASEIIVFGFYGSNFTIYNYTKSYRISTFDCGGAKGTFDVSYDPYYRYVDPSSAHYNTYFAAFSKGGILHTHTEMKHTVENLQFQKESMNLNYHGRETRDVLLWKSERSQKVRLITCSEDTTIRILEFVRERTELSTAFILNGHESGIKALSLVEFGDHWILFSGGGKEELFIWRVVETADGNVYADLLQDNQITYKFMKVFHPEIQFNPNKVHFRVMSITAFPVSENGDFCLITGASDGLAKIFIYNATTNVLTPHSFSVFHKGPVLSMQHVQITDDQWLVFTGSTDGAIAVYMLNRALLQTIGTVHSFDPVHTFNAHQSGVNSLSVNASGTTITIASGGDDQALFVARFEWLGNSVEQAAVCKLPDIHTAAVNGIYTDGRYVYETSIDQRFNIFRITNGGALALDLQCSHMVEVNDISAMSTLSTTLDAQRMRTDVAIAGAELQILSVTI